MQGTKNDKPTEEGEVGEQTGQGAATMTPEQELKEIKEAIEELESTLRKDRAIRAKEIKAFDEVEAKLRAELAEVEFSNAIRGILGKSGHPRDYMKDFDREAKILKALVSDTKGQEGSQATKGEKVEKH